MGAHTTRGLLNVRIQTFSFISSQLKNDVAIFASKDSERLYRYGYDRGMYATLCSW